MFREGGWVKMGEQHTVPLLLALCVFTRLYRNVAGSVIEKLGALGFRHVINRCEDFYAAVAEKRLPPHDVLLTNPPYSADHMENILRFCSQQNGDTPWLVLMPNFVYTKNYYNDATSGTSPFYIAPLKR
jgi:hypothetical protein